jgi:hypothetical protein
MLNWQLLVWKRKSPVCLGLQEMKPSKRCLEVSVEADHTDEGLLTESFNKILPQNISIISRDTMTQSMPGVPKFKPWDRGVSSKWFRSFYQ